MFGQGVEAAVQGHHRTTQAAMHGLQQLMDGIGLQHGVESGRGCEGMSMTGKMHAVEHARGS